MSYDASDPAELSRHNELQRIRMKRLKDELRAELGREPTDGEIAEAVTTWFGKYFREINSDLNNWGTGEELMTNPRAMPPEDAVTALEQHHLRFCPSPKQQHSLKACEDST